MIAMMILSSDQKSEINHDLLSGQRYTDDVHRAMEFVWYERCGLLSILTVLSAIKVMRVERWKDVLTLIVERS